MGDKPVAKRFRKQNQRVQWPLPSRRLMTIGRSSTVKDRHISAALERLLEHVDAIDTLGSSLAAGLHAGVVTHDHVQTLMMMMATQLRGYLKELSAAMGKPLV